MFRFIRIGLACLITNACFTPLSFGQTVENLPNAVRLTLAGGETVVAQVCGDRIIHVTAQPKGAPAIPASYVIDHSWSPVKFLVKSDDPSAVVLTTGELTVRIDKATGAVSFQDAQGMPILNESDRSFTPVTVNKESTYQVQQSFHSPGDESLYGLGQFQDGHWNWKGIPLEFRQTNTQVVVPMLLSNKGYGLMWDNASMTEFNPVDDEIPLTGSSTDQNDANTPKATEELGKTTVKKEEDDHAVRNGTFTSKAEGDYVFLANNGNRFKELTILIDGEPALSMNNLWLPYSCSTVKHLPANTTVKVALRGGGVHVRLWARPLHPEITTFRSPVGNGTDYYFFYGPDLQDVIAQYRVATGAAPLFPEWAYGFWQCREHYASSDELTAAVAGYRGRNIPVDLVVQDWYYWGHWGPSAYQWDETRYPDPAKLIRDLHDQHVRFMISVWPNPSGPVHEALKASPHGILTGNLYDPTSPEARKIRWSFLQKAFFDIGTDAWWQDAAEPMDPGNDMAGKNTFLGSGDFYRDSYPLFHSETIYDGQRMANPEKRVVNLTRSGYLGQQRYGTCTWSGDIAGDWVTFRRQIPAGLNFCMTGLPYWTTDTAGFFHPNGQYQSEDYNDLLVRWFQFSTFCPVLRVHGYGTHTEFWNYLPQTQTQLTAYDDFRHRLLPYTYSMAWQVTNAGSTMMRALPLDFRTDAKACSISDEYMFGSAFLVSPVTEPKATTRKVYLPQGAGWYDFWTGQKSQGGQEVQAATPLAQIPLHIREGSILPLGPVVQYAGEKPADPIELRVYPGQDGHFHLYEDEGDSYRYEQGVRAIIPLAWSEKTQTLTLGDRQGSFPGMLKERTFRVIRVKADHGVGLDETEKADATVHYDGTSQTVPLN